MKRAESGPIAEAWDIEDHLTALNARLSPLKTIGVHLLDAAIRAYNVLWPGSEAPASVSELARCLMASEDRLIEWRESAARVGADEAMSFVLSWYEGINLDVLQKMRLNSKWTTDPDLVKRRQERAYSFIPYADIHKFVEAPDESENDDEDAEDVDEEIQADIAPNPAADTTSDINAPSTDPSSSGTAA